MTSSYTVLYRMYHLGEGEFGYIGYITTRGSGMQYIQVILLNIMVFIFLFFGLQNTRHRFAFITRRCARCPVGKTTFYYAYNNNMIL